MKLIDLTGQRFGKLVVVDRAENAPKGQPRWLCRCDCGNQTVVWGVALRTGHTSSCSCLSRETTTERNMTHGHATRAATTSEYRSYESAKRRCTKPNEKRYPDY